MRPADRGAAPRARVALRAGDGPEAAARVLAEALAVVDRRMRAAAPGSSTPPPDGARSTRRASAPSAAAAAGEGRLAGVALARESSNDCFDVRFLSPSSGEAPGPEPRSRAHPPPGRRPQSERRIGRLVAAARRA